MRSREREQARDFFDTDRTTTACTGSGSSRVLSSVNRAKTARGIDLSGIIRLLPIGTSLTWCLECFAILWILRDRL